MTCLEVDISGSAASVGAILSKDMLNECVVTNNLPGSRARALFFSLAGKARYPKWLLAANDVFSRALFR